MKKILILIAVALPLCCLAQEKVAIDSTKVKWISLEQAEKLCKTNPKKILIDAYTDWCGWCKKMDKETFQHPEIAKYLNQQFYTVKFNAETKDTITFLGSKYINFGSKTHPLAISLLGWRLSYPSIVYMTENFEYLGPMPGYKNALQMEAILHYIAEEKYKTISLEEFEKTYKGKVQ